MANQTNDTLMDSAISAQESRQYSKAAEIYFKILKEEPSNPDANHNLGVLCMTIGEVNKAVSFLKNALRLNDQVYIYWSNYLNAMIRLNKLREAETIIKKIKLKGFKQEVFSKLAHNLKLKLSDSVPQEPDLSLVEDIFIEINEERYAIAHSMTAALLFEFPNSARLTALMGSIENKLGKHDQSLDLYLKSLSINNKQANVHSNLGKIFLSKLDKKKAKTHFSAALKLDPNNPIFHYNIAKLYTSTGQKSLAKNHLERAILLDPKFSAAYKQICKVSYFGTNSKISRKMRDYFSDAVIPTIDRSNYAFGLAGVYEDAAEYAKAFSFLCEANRMRRENLDFDLTLEIQKINTSKNNQDLLQQISKFEELEFESDLKIIFIVGMPRSGTTLLDQILSCHPKIASIAESDIISRQCATFASGNLSSSIDDLKHMKAKVLNSIKKLAPNQNIIVEKTPANFIYIGLIKFMFPNAKIIHIQRSPHATCWSLFRNSFEDGSLEYSYDMGEIVDYYNLYDKLMSSWSELLGSRIYHLSYEKLVESQFKETKMLLDYCKLDFDPLCLYPEKNSRIVLTAANQQIRKAVYSGSSDEWKKYKDLIGAQFNDLRNTSSDFNILTS